MNNLLSRSSLKITLIFFIGVFLGLGMHPDPLWAKKKIIPVPAVSTSRNDGIEYGTLVVVLFSDDEDNVHSIFAPSLTYNENIGLTGTFRLFLYGEDNRDYTIILSASDGIDQKIVFELSDPKIFGGRWVFDSSIKVYRDSTRRFFGFSSDSLVENETNYTLGELKYNFSLGKYFSKNFRLSFGERLRWVSISGGSVKSKPFLRDVFGGIPGDEGGLVLGHRIILTYDSRDELDIPTQGIFIQFYSELGQSFQKGENQLFNGTGLDMRCLFPFREGRFVTVVRGEVRLTSGKDTPFYEKASLGGDDSLRNFGEGRFVDDHYFNFGIEERIRFARLRILGVLADWEFAPFVDVGRVFSSFDGLLDDIQVNPGFGIRALIRPNVVGRFDAGFGPEGMTLFVGLDYPF